MLIFQEIRKPPIYFYVNKTGITKERRRNFLTINFSFNHMGGFKQNRLCINTNEEKPLSAIIDSNRIFP